MDIFSNFLINTIYASLFLIVLSHLGDQTLKVLCIKVNDVSFCALTGLMITLVVAWGARNLPVESRLMIVHGVIAIAALSLLIKLISQSGIWYRENVMSITLTTTFASFLASYIGKGNQVAVIGNNDLFNWYSVAAHFAGFGDYFKMAPAARLTYDGSNLAIDGFGTVWFLILAGIGQSELILSAQVAVIILLTMIALSVQSQISLFIHNRIATSAASWAIISSPLLIYVAFNGFFAHMLATVAGIMLIYAALSVAIQPSLSWRHKFILFFVPVSTLLICYQSGFLIFNLIMIGFLACVGLMALIKHGSFKSVGDEISSTVLPYVVSLVLALGVFSDLAIYLVRRTIYVADVQAGWALPLSHPAALLVAISAVLFVSNILLRHSQSLKQFSSYLVGGLLWTAMLVIIYFIWYHSGRAPYQNWKFASFFSYTLVFVVIVPLVSSLVKPSDFNTVELKRMNIAFYSSLSLSFLVVGLNFYYVSLFQKRTTVYDEYVKELVELRKYLDAGSSLVLDLPPFSDTMLAMQVLSKDIKLFPISNTYISPVGLNELKDFASQSNINYRVLKYRDKNKCRSVNTGDVVYQSTHYTVSDLQLAIPSGFAYSFASKCVPMSVEFVKGVSGWEPWGRWTDGNDVVLRFDIAEEIKNSKLFMVFDVAPHMPPGIEGQRISVAVNGHIVLTDIVRTRGSLRFEIPSALKLGNYVEIEFNLPDAVSPAAVSSSLDTRVLGLGLHTMELVIQ